MTSRVGGFTLIARIASGGMADVYLARGEGSERVVIKLLHARFAGDPLVVDMFSGEARIAAMLRHPNIVRVRAFDTAGGRPFLVLDHLEGAGFSALVGRLPRDDAHDLRVIATMLAQACEGLHHAHELGDGRGKPLGIVHRDVTPSNLFATIDGRCVLLDFGIAKVTSAVARTRPRTIKGKLSYVAPEYVRQEPLDRRADLFSLGVVLFEAATRRRLFLRDGRRATLRAVAEAPIPPLRAERADAPPALAAVVERALQRDPARRFGTARELAAALLDAVAPLGGPIAAEALAPEIAGRCADEIAARRALIDRAERSGVLLDAVEDPEGPPTEELSDAPTR